MILPSRRAVAAGLGAMLAGGAAARAGTGWDADFVAALAVAAGSPVDPDRAWRRIEAERGRVVARAQALFHRIGAPAGPLGARYRGLWRDPAYLYPDNAAGRDRLVADMARVLAAIRPRLGEIFPPLPVSLTDVGVRALTATEVAAGRSGYRQLPAPGRPGLYIVDVREIRRRPAWTLPAVVAHELLPGHMIQLPLAAAAPTPAPRGLAEGWAVWAEVLAARRGWLGDDPRVMLGLCHWLLFRLHRARADLAINVRRESPDAVLRTWQAEQGEPVYFADFAREMARIPRESGTRTAEALAWLALQDGAAGRDDAGLRAYHARVLGLPSA